MLSAPLRLTVLSLAVAGLLAGCSTPPPPLKFPEMSFSQKAPIRLTIGRIEIDPEYKAPASRPHIEYDMPVSPENALRRWVRDRLQAVGRQGTLRVVIRNASATEVPLPTDQGVSGMFKQEQSARVDLALDVELQILDDHQFVVASVSGQATRSRTEPEGQKLNQRDQLLYDLTYDLLHGFDDEISPNIPTGFNRWLEIQ